LSNRAAISAAEIHRVIERGVPLPGFGIISEKCVRAMGNLSEMALDIQPGSRWFLPGFGITSEKCVRAMGN
jgi:hypothetical protein